MSSTLDSFRPGSAKAHFFANWPLIGEKPNFPLIVMLLGTFFNIVPLIVWTWRGIFPDTAVNIVLLVAGTILLLVSVLMVKAEASQLRSNQRNFPRA